MATHIESDEWERNDEEVSSKFKQAVATKTETPKENKTPNLTKKSADLFDELFGDK